MLVLSDYSIKPQIFDNPLFRVHLKCFRLYGYIIGNDQDRAWLHWLRCTIFTASIWISCALMLMNVLQGYKHFQEGATSYATAVQFLAVSVATMNAYFQRKRVVRLVLLAHSDMQTLYADADAIESLLIERTVRYVRIITYALWISSSTAGFIALLDCIYRTFFMPETVFNVPEGAQPILLFKLFPFGAICDNFLISYVAPYYAMLLGITTIPLWHTFITCLMKFVTLRLEILCKRMSEMDIKRLNKSLNVEQLREYERNYWRLKLCGHFVEEQLKIRRFVAELESLLRVPVFADFIIFAVLMCFLFFAIAVGVPSKMDYFFTFIYLCCMSSILWLYHWHSTLIVEENERLSFSIYCCDWYNYTVQVQKSVLLLMTLATRPLNMRALFVELNLKTFIDIMRGAYSYFNLLRSMNIAGANN